MKVLDKIKYNIDHRRAVLAVEKEITGKNTVLTRLHDFDKLIMICLFIPSNIISKIHRFWSWHHCENKIGWLRLDELIYDWSAARRTKPNKQRNVLDTAYYKYPNMYTILYNRLLELNNTNL